MHRIDSFVNQTVGRDSGRELIKREASKQNRKLCPLRPVRCSPVSLKPDSGPEVTGVMDGIRIVGLVSAAKRTRVQCFSSKEAHYKMGM